MYLLFVERKRTTSRPNNVITVILEIETVSVSVFGAEFSEQECISVGCVPSASVAIWGDVCPGGVCPERVSA